MEEGPDPMDFDLNARSQLPARPLEEGRRLEAQDVCEHFTPEFPHHTELKLGVQIRPNRLRNRSNEAQEDEEPDDLRDG